MNKKKSIFEIDEERNNRFSDIGDAKKCGDENRPVEKLNDSNKMKDNRNFKNVKNSKDSGNSQNEGGSLKNKKKLKDVKNSKVVKNIDNGKLNDNTNILKDNTKYNANNKSNTNHIEENTKHDKTNFEKSAKNKISNSLNPNKKHLPVEKKTKIPKHQRNFDIKNGIKRVKKDDNKSVDEIITTKNDNEFIDEPKINSKDLNKTNSNKDSKFSKIANKSKNTTNDKSTINEKNTTNDTTLTKLEKEILKKGTIKDKLNLLSLIIERNPTDENYKNLLFYTENQRNDVIYLTLKNLKDILISQKKVPSPFIKNKITKSLEINLKNSFIKSKTIRLVYDLLKNNILFIDLIYPFINKLGDNKLKPYVLLCIPSIIDINQEIFILNLEDFYFKNKNYKCTSSIIKVFDIVTDKSKLINLYRSILEDVFMYKDEYRNICIEKCYQCICTFESSIIEQIFFDENGKNVVEYGKAVNMNCEKSADENSPNIKNKENIENINLIQTQLYKNIKNSTYTKTMTYYSFILLYKLKDTTIKNFVYNNIYKLYDFEDVPTIIKSIYDQNKEDEFISKLFYYSFITKKEFLLFILNIINENKIKVNKDLLLTHYSGVIRNSVDKVVVECAFDNVQVELYEGIYN